MRDISQIMARTIASLGYSVTTRNSVVIQIKKYKYPKDKFKLGDKKYYELCEQLAKQFTVKDLISAYDASPCYYRGGYMHPFPQISERISCRLVKLGLTHLDWKALPINTVTTQMLRRLGKKELLGRSILLLGTLSFIALRELVKYFNKDLLDITIRDLTGTSEETWDWSGNLKRSIAKTRQKLLEIGFRYEDGIFLQEGTKRQLVEDLAAETNLSHNVVTKVVDVSQKRHLLKKLFFESDVGL